MVGEERSIYRLRKWPVRVCKFQLPHFLRAPQKQNFLRKIG
jgi:hypothetical protein